MTHVLDRGRGLTVWNSRALGRLVEASESQALAYSLGVAAPLRTSALFEENCEKLCPLGRVSERVIYGLISII